MLGLVLLPLCAIHVCLAGELIRIEEKLTTDREFYDQWMQLISLQAEQLEEQSLDYPLSVDSLNSCSRVPPGDTEDLSDSLRPSSVSVYADIGHLTAYCKSNFSVLQAGILDSCDHRATTMELPSLDKMLRIFNPGLTVIESNERDDSLEEQARYVAMLLVNYYGLVVKLLLNCFGMSLVGVHSSNPAYVGQCPNNTLVHLFIQNIYCTRTYT
ncbi:unnamed protein product [Heligmosomoides polygyrus]|uniref:Secreted protein n=1 Tax=Heligmosomoides polygyrus TaxID=6339 RepID=A0A183G7F8_HELPZ|nr:unnamed protein product [Heligmosomoides polygyrus]